MKKIIILTLISLLPVALSESNTITPNWQFTIQELIKLLDNDLDFFDTYVSKKGYSIQTSKQSVFYEQNIPAKDHKEISHFVNSITYFLDETIDSIVFHQSVLYAFYQMDQFLILKEGISKNFEKRKSRREYFLEDHWGFCLTPTEWIQYNWEEYSENEGGFFRNEDYRVLLTARNYDRNRGIGFENTQSRLDFMAKKTKITSYEIYIFKRK